MKVKAPRTLFCAGPMTLPLPQACARRGTGVVLSPPSAAKAFVVKTGAELRLASRDDEEPATGVQLPRVILPSSARVTPSIVAQKPVSSESVRRALWMEWILSSRSEEV